MKSKIKYFLFLLLINIYLPINVFAQENIILKVDKTDLQIGDEITIRAITHDTLDSYAFIATLKYDHNVFKEITDTDFSLDETSSITYNKDNKKFGIINKTGKVTNTLFSVRLKVKENANVGFTNIGLTNISSSDGSSSINIPMVSTKVFVSRDAYQGEEVKDTIENTITNENEEVIKVSTNKKIIIALIIITIASFVVSIYILIKNKKIKKSWIFLTILEAFLIIGIVLLSTSNYHKKDVNKDGVKDYQDAEEIIKYLIDVSKTEDENSSINDTSFNDNTNNNSNNSSNFVVNTNTNNKDKYSSTDNNKNNQDKGNTSNKNPNNKPEKEDKSKEDYDTNNDGKVDINDAGHVTEDTTKNSQVKLHEENSLDEYYVNKGSITLKFKAEITPKEAKIIKIKIDDKYYDVTLNNNIYEVELKDINKAGIHEFNITEVELDNKKKVDVKLKITREILKDIPYVNEFNLDDENRSLSFDLVDKEEAFISGHARIFDSNNKEISIKEINVGKNTLLFEAEEGKKYKIEIIGSYDLDSKRNDNKNAYNNKEMFFQDFTIGGNYNFTLTDFSITDAISIGETPKISFKSTNNRNALVVNATLTIGNKHSEFNITKRDGINYEVELNGVDTTLGKHTVTLDNVGLNSLKTFYNNEDYKVNSLTYTVLKEKPSIENLELTNNSEIRSILATFNLKDINSSVNKLTVVLLDSNAKIVSSEVIEEDELKLDNINVLLDYKDSVDGFYTVKVLGDYKLSDKYIYTNTVLDEKSILVTNDIYIEKMYITNNSNANTGNNNLYPNKLDKNYQVAVELYLGPSINANARNKYKADYSQVSSVTINGLNYPASKIDGYKSKVYLNIPNKSGILNIKANRVQLTVDGYYKMYSTDLYSVEEKELTVDVLKDKPKIENLVITDDYEKATVTVNFDVVLDEFAKDNDFYNGAITLGNITKGFNVGKNEIIFEDVLKDTNLNLIFQGSYDLDTDILNDKTGEKNEVLNEKLLEVKYGLYKSDTYQDISISNGKAVSNASNSYFVKNEKIKLNFDILGIKEELNVSPKMVVIDNKEYVLTKLDTGYQIILDGYYSSGKKDITITDIILNNGKKVTLKDFYTFNFEVLKDKVTINDFTFKELDDKIQVNFDLKDLDKSLVKDPLIVITDEAGLKVYENTYNKEITFNLNGSVRYYVKVIADYDLDTDKEKGSSNYNIDSVLLNEVISLDKRVIELKDITDISLYKLEKQNEEEVNVLKDTIKVSDLNSDLNSYFVEISMENMPSIRAKINKVIEKDNKLILSLEYEYIREEESKLQIIRVTFGSIENGIATNEVHPIDSFKALIKELESNKDVTLTHDYDASGVEAQDYYVTSFSKVLDGNGYTIKNLNKPLFKELNGGTVKNIKLENIKLLADNKSINEAFGNGAIASTSSNHAILKDILIDYFDRAGEKGPVGTLLGSASNTTIENVGAKNFTIRSISGWATSLQGVGGLVGRVDGNVTIKNSYAVGTFNGGWNFRGGLVGNVNGVNTFENNYTKVNIINGVDSNIACGFVCNGGSSIFKNNISFSTGGMKYKMFGGASLSENNYYVGLDTDNDTNATKLQEKDITTLLFKDTLKFKDDIWNLNNISYDNLPTLQIEKVPSLSDTSSDMYNEANELLYANLLKLMPYYDSNKIIEFSQNINDNLFINEELIHIAPVDINGNLVTYLTKDNLKKINKIKLVFKNGAQRVYNVTYDKVYDMVATYKINDLNIDYNYNNYVIDSNSQVVNNLVNYLKGLDYTTNLDILTTNDDSRIYRDFYNETTSKELKEFVLKYLSNSEYTNTTNDFAINNYIEREVKKNQRIEKALYTYNYFRRFYDLDIDGMKLYDFVLFNMKGFNKNLTLDGIINLYFSDLTGANFNTATTNNVYNNLFSKYTGLTNISNFLEYIVTHFSNNNMDKWTFEEFDGILTEIPVKGHENDIDYTLWDHLSTEDAVYKGESYRPYNFILPILTLPKNAAYIVSSPTQFTIGAQRVYMENPNDPAEVAKFKAKMKAYTDRMENYYNTAYSILEDKKLFNDIHLYQLDKRTTKNEFGVSVYNTPYSTTEPFHKNFDEVVGLWPATYGVNAGNWGDRIEWNVAGFMDTDITVDGTLDDGHPTFMTWSHETAHYIDARLFLKNNGRRFDSGGEDYADAFLMQEFSNNGIVMNLTVNYKKDLEVASNLTPERINSKDKIYDFYNKMFKTIYTIDYIEAKAFLKLAPEEKAVLGIQVDYPNKNKYTLPDNLFRARLVSGYHERTKEEWENMKLNDINDLIDNQIMLYPGVYKYASRGDNSYGGEGINTVHWYQPNNPLGRPDSYALKWFSYEMLGYKGYDKGFVEYASNINPITHNISVEVDNPEKGSKQVNNYKSDSIALKRITNYESMNEYKKARFKETEGNLKYLKYINVDYYAQELYNALVKDVTDMNLGVEKLFKDYGGEENCTKDFWCTRYLGSARGYPNSTKVRQEIYFKIKNATNDFTEDIYEKEITQDITFNITTNKDS